MNNQVISRILSEIAIYLEMQGVPFKPRAYEKASEVILGLDRDVGEIYKQEGIN